MDPVVIDGSAGEGGGQILHSSLALSLATGRAVRVERIRAGRTKGGLLRQHLTCVDLARRIGCAEVDGATLRSETLVFRPSALTAGTHEVKVGTAGSTALVAQAVLPALLLANGPTTLAIEGGTHAQNAPAFEFLRDAFAPLLERMGARVAMRLERHGFFPAGGGRIVVEVERGPAWIPLDLRERGGRVSLQVEILTSQLPEAVADRMAAEVRSQLRLSSKDIRRTRVTDSLSPGGSVIITMQHRAVTEVFVAHASRGVRSERVAGRACHDAKRWMKAEAPVGGDLADQLLLPLALAAGGRFRTAGLSPHARTNIDVIEVFLGPCVTVEEAAEGGVDVVVTGRS